MSLPNDTARCTGWPADSQRIAGEILCVDCQRRTQIALDTAKSGQDAFYWHMGPAINNGRCVYYIAPEKSTC